MMMVARVTRLADLLPTMELGDMAQLSVTGMTLDSRKVEPGDLFVALKGAQADGRDYIDDAFAQGAEAVLVEAAESDPSITLQAGKPIIAVPNLATNLSAIAGRCYRQPSERLKLVGITGTNGKTTCALLLAQLCAGLSSRAGVIGTLGFGLLESDQNMTAQLEALTHTGLTTPDAISMQRILRQLVDVDAGLVAMEVSSHSLSQNRVKALTMSAALFTNLTQDHLDFHENMQAYGAAKATLLRQPGLRHAIVNRDDDWAASLLQALPETVTGLSYSLDNTDADVYLTERFEQRSGVSALLHTPWGRGELHSPLLGSFNLSNLLGVIAAACVSGFTLEDILAAVPYLVPAPGRMESVILDEQRQDLQLVVDYAHTPDALENSLQALSAHNTGRLWCVFGCGGDRDRDKRPMMGRIAERLCDFVIVTNDNPRKEDPAQITADILKGMDNDHQCLVIADRANAIDLAVQQARSGDTVLVAGKGHEDYQIFAEQTVSFSDREQLKHSMRRRLTKATDKGVAS